MQRSTILSIVALGVATTSFLGSGLLYHQSSTLEGYAVVTDGDSLSIRGTRIRLFGIDAPELSQRCIQKSDGSAWRCGVAAASALSYITAGKLVTCHVHSHDRYSRAVASCEVEGRSINSMMVRIGMAVAYTRYSLRYVADEQAARTDQVGIWNSVFTPFETYRHEVRK